MRGVVVEGRRRGSSLGFGSKLNLKIDQRRHSEHRLKVIDIIKIKIEQSNTHKGECPCARKYKEAIT